MRFIALIFVGPLLLHGTAYAKNDQVEFGPTPDWVNPSELMAVPEDASGLVFIRRQDVLVHLNEQGQVHYNGSRAKILHPNALQIGNLSISWNPSSGVPTVHTIKLHREGEVIDLQPKASFEILRREDQLEAAVLDGVLTAVTRIPDLRVGDELEVAYSTSFNDLTLGNNSAGLILLQGNPPLGRFHLGLNWIKGQEPNIKMSNDMLDVAKKSERAIEFLFNSPAGLMPAKDAPPRYSWQRVLEFSDFSNWNSISQLFSKLFAEASTFSNTSPLQQEVDRIAKTNTSQLDRANAALNLVQQDVRYIYVGFDGRNLTPATAEDTWQRRYGDCKGKTSLLLGLLAKLGIEAEPVLANNTGGDDGLDQRLPNPGMFDHVLVRARIDGKLYYLDPTLPSVVPPTTTPVLPYRWILPLNSQGSSIERIAQPIAEQPDELTLFEIDAREGFNKPARITNTIITRGVKGLGYQMQLSGLTAGELQRVMSQQMIGDTWQTIEDVQWQFDKKAQASVLKITGTGTVDWDDDGDGEKSLALPGGGFIPPSKRIRAADQDQNLPYYNNPEFECHVTTVRIPASTEAKQWSFQKGFDTRLFGRNYYRSFDLREGSIRMVRGSRIEQQEVDAQSAKRDNDLIASFDNSMAWIYYDPEDQNFAVSSGKLVPATYDIDWTLNSDACLSNVIKD